MAVPIRRRGPRGGLVSTRIPVRDLNSVSTHADNKRMPNECDQLDNCLVSLERGLEKRPGFEIVPQATIPGLTGWDFLNTNTRFDLYNLPESPSTKDLFYYWYSINEDNNYLIAINYDATGSTDKLFYVFQLNANGTWTEQTPEYQWDPTDPSLATSNSVISSYVGSGKPFATYAAALAAGVVNKDSRTYITWKTGTKTARDSLRVVSVGANIIILNTNVYAGFSSDTDGKLFNLDGIVDTTKDDIEGRPVIYYSAAKVMKVYDKGDDGIAGTSDDLLLGWKASTSIGTVNTTAAVGATSVVLNVNTLLPASYYNGSTITFSGSTTVYTIGSGTTVNTTSSGITVTVPISPALTAGVTASTTTYSISIAGGQFIPSGDYFYYNTAQAYLGQRVNDISGIRLPPEDDDWYANNSSTTDTNAKQMLQSLHDPDTKYPTVINGRGKIYYAINPYLGTTSGYYRVISWQPNVTLYKDSSNTIYTTTGPGRTAITGSGRPYLQKVRTPDEHSYIDPRRMPQKLAVDITSPTVKWSMSKIKWTPRTTGDKITNPGPSVFKTTDGKSLKQVQIKAMAVFKDRLWFAANDTVFSTRTGQYENLFFNDPANIVTTDPIDIRASSNQYAEISSMVPFEEYLFVDTKASTQFQLMSASTMELSPTNVAIAPMSFYSTAPITLPQLIGSRLYFFGPQRLYLFVGKNNLGYSSALEASTSVIDYLPVNYRSICTAPAQDSLVMVSEENSNEVYFYTNRFSGDRMIQNSFYRYVLDSALDIRSVKVIKNYLYAVVYMNMEGPSGSTGAYVIMKSKLIYEDRTVPRMDRMLKIKCITANTSASPNMVYESGTDETVIRVPKFNYDLTSKARVVLGTDWEDENGEDISLTTLTDTSYNDPSGIIDFGYQEVRLRGDYTGIANGKYIYIGETFETRITLSTLFVRDENNNIIQGVLNLRTGVFRHFNTGNYRIEVSNRGRTAMVSKFTADRPDATSGEDVLPLKVLQEQGEFVAKVYGFADHLQISIVSDYTTPMNITNMEFKGKFKQKYTTLT